MINKIYNIEEWALVSSVATPSSSAQIIYPKIDGNWYHMGNNGLEKILSNSYDIGNGLTYSAATNSYDYKLSINVDNVGLTISNGLLRIGYLTASSLSQNGGATSGYIISVNSLGGLIWVPYTTQGVNGAMNYIAKFNSSTSVTNSNIYDNGTTVTIGGNTGSNIGSNIVLYSTGDIDIANKLYFTSSVFTYITSLDGQKITVFSDGLNIKNSANTFLNITKNLTNGSSISLLDSLILITTTGSNNFTASVSMQKIKQFGIGTSAPTNLFHLYATQSAFRLEDGSQGLGKYLISDTNGLSSWSTLNGIGISVNGATFSINTPVGSGLTANIVGLSILLPTNSGLTISLNGLSINPSLAGSGLTYSGGSFSVLNVLNPGNGLTSSGNTFSLNLGYGLTFSSTKLVLDSSLAGNGLTYSNGVLSSSIIGVTNSLPYFNNFNSLASSVISQISNNILIGTTSNNGAKLQIAGSFSSTKDVIINGIYIGKGLGNHIIFGATALSSEVGGFGSVAIGQGALMLATNTIGNIAIGYEASKSQTNNGSSLAIGYLALTKKTTINEATAVGHESLSNLTTGYDTTALGWRSGWQLTTAFNTTAIGNRSVYTSITSNNTTALGAYSYYYGTSSAVTAIGVWAGQLSGDYGVYLGMNSGYGGVGNIAIGFDSGGFLVNSIGSYNVSIGYLAGASFSGSNNIVIGGYSTATNSSNGIYIADGQGNLVIYSPSSHNILIGTMSDNGSKFIVSGSASIITATPGALRLVDTTQAIGRVLVSDNNGVATWKDYKNYGTQSFIANNPVTITHNLNTLFYMIQLFDYLTGEEIFGAYTSRNSNDVIITLTFNVPICGYIIIG